MSSKPERRIISSWILGAYELTIRMGKNSIVPEWNNSGNVLPVHPFLESFLRKDSSKRRTEIRNSRAGLWANSAAWSSVQWEETEHAGCPWPFLDPAEKWGHRENVALKSGKTSTRRLRASRIRWERLNHMAQPQCPTSCGLHLQDSCQFLFLKTWERSFTFWKGEGASLWMYQSCLGQGFHLSTTYPSLVSCSPDRLPVLLMARRLKGLRWAALGHRLGSFLLQNNPFPTCPHHRPLVEGSQLTTKSWELFQTTS